MIMIVIMEIRQKRKRKEREKPKKKSKEALNVCFRFVTRVMGFIISSENSLNQHIKLKHPELWSKYKHIENNNSEGVIGLRNDENEDKKSE